MAKKHLLSMKEAKYFFSLLCDVHRFIDKLHRKFPLTEHIQFPKLPSIFTESLALVCIRKGFLLKKLRGKIVSSNLGGGTADILLGLKNSKKKLRVEVKGTGEKRFTYLWRKDIAADYLIWVVVPGYHTNKARVIEFYSLAKPKRFFKLGHRNLKDFLRIGGNSIERKILKL